jgi:hypothetical protein
MSLVVLRRVSTYEEAVVLAGALRSAGITTEVFDSFGQQRWTLQNALGGFRIMVMSSDLEEARAFLAALPPPADEDDDEPPEARAPRRGLALALIALFGG